MSIPVEVLNVIKDNKGFFISAGVEILAVGGAAGGYIIRKIDDARLIKEKKISFETGVRKGKNIAVNNMRQIFIDPILARVAVSYYIARADGKITESELRILNEKTGQIINNPDIPNPIKKEAKSIASNKNINSEIVISYLEKLNELTLASIMFDVTTIAEVEGINEKEQEAISLIEEYILYRLKDNYKISDKLSYEDMQQYMDNIVSEEEINEVVNKYDLKMKILDRKFSKLTHLNFKELSILMLAISLQLIRIYLMNYISTVEKAGNQNLKEKFLHKKQDKLLKNFAKDNTEVSDYYYAPMYQIVTGRGVPYDATRYKNENLKLFKGANHRFSTLGHEPIVGLVVGTTNIMTNTITTISDFSPIPHTHHVVYDDMLKNPEIENEASLILALKAVVNRSAEDITPLVAAFIKQLIHIATDLYTPAGIQLPGVNLLLSKKNVEVLTSYVNTGDLVKIGASSTINDLIDKLIAILHGCMLLEESDNILNKINQAKTKKIIVYSNLIATSSNVLKTTYTGNLHNMDWAGLIKLTKKICCDRDFMYNLKWEFINEGLKQI